MKVIILVMACALFMLTQELKAAEKSVYDFSWLDQDKEIYVLQNRKFRKEGKLYGSIGGGKTLNGTFIDSYSGQARVGYFFREDWGIELLYSKGSGSENDTAKAIASQGAVPFYRKVDNSMGGMLVWSPFYGKLNTFNKVFYFDWIFGAGVAKVHTLDNRLKFNTIPSGSLTGQDTTGALWNTGIRFYMSEHWALRIDVTGTHISATRQKSSTTSSKTNFSYYDLNFGLNYTF